MSKSEWPRCDVPRKDGKPCGSSTRKGPDGNPAEDGRCVPHAPKVEQRAQEIILEAVSPTPEPDPEVVPASVAVGSLRDALRDAVSTEEVAELMRRVLLDALEASKETWSTCPHCNKRHPINLPDLGVRAQAVRSLIDSLEGRLKEQTDAEERQLNRKAQIVKQAVHELSDDDLALRIAQLEEELGYEQGGQWDSQAGRYSRRSRS